jgi:hypothetical protein
MKLDVLISEVAGPGRWCQFNLKLGWVPVFFGTPLDAPYTVPLTQVDAGGNVTAHCNTQAIYKPNSSNWGFEIPGASDLTFPGILNRPIIIIAQTLAGHFPFELVMPGEAPYAAVSAFLQAERQTTAPELARCIVNRGAIPAGNFGVNF